ncbi:FG-GAP repeat protein [Pseudoalteromonas sp. MMG005]|uniref:FG-GAP repeat protein n=1 Tax=Pseudoalteromonas sp. MMG005 TaxID=2822682 RepID=UPI001B39F563|nr:FG-GAP repeat protein [Pseudoalteromonas sp. MMG005]MBQ4848358.1 FG-GAP repeat protein [Pseudoalteromonas sp. MMG005]
MTFNFSLKILSCFALIAISQSYAKQQKLLPDDAKTGDQFGFSVAIDGTTALVGAHKADAKSTQDAGAAYVYSLNAGGWQQQAKLVAKPAYANDTFGGNVALKNDIAMLGVIKRDDKGEDAGAVFAFEKEVNSWSQKQILTANDGKSGDAFGQSIALTERFLVIGAPHSDAPEHDSGAVYVYIRDKGAWRFHTKLTAKDGADGDLFGISVAIDGDTILVGADLHDEKAEQAGAVYAYVFDGKNWHHQAKLTATDGEKVDIFGVRVALLGDTALISARRDDVEGIGTDAGSAYIFERVKGKWIQTQKLVAPDGKADDRFARGVALNKETALISAMHHDMNGSNAGALYVFKKERGLWRYISKIVASDGVPEDRFGWNIAFSDNTAIVAVPHRDDNGDASGAAYVFDLGE